MLILDFNLTLFCVFCFIHTVQVIMCWHRLPTKVVESPSLEITEPDYMGYWVAFAS